MTVAASYRHITGAGDDGVVSAVPCRLFGVVVGSPSALQTLSLHDCATEAEAAAGNLVSRIALDSQRNVTFGTDGVRMRVGIVAIVSAGAPDVTVVFG